MWYRYTPRVEINRAIYTALIDKYHNIFQQKVFTDYMRLGHVSEPGQPIYTPEAKDVDLALYTEIILPEQSKYDILERDQRRTDQPLWIMRAELRQPVIVDAEALTLQL